MSTGNQFALIPWREQIRSGGLRAWPDAAVSILPVLAVHESPLLEACPSQNLGQFCLWDSFVFANCPTENRWYIWQWDNWDGWDSVLGYGLSRFLSGRGKDDAHGKVNGMVNTVDLKKSESFNLAGVDAFAGVWWVTEIRELEACGNGRGVLGLFGCRGGTNTVRIPFP